MVEVWEDTLVNYIPRRTCHGREREHFDHRSLFHAASSADPVENNLNPWAETARAAVSGFRRPFRAGVRAATLGIAARRLQYATFMLVFDKMSLFQSAFRHTSPIEAVSCW